MSLLEARDFPVSSLRLFASSRSAGELLPFRGDELAVVEATPDGFTGCDLVFFSAGASRSRQFAPAAQRAGAVVIDNSSAFRMRQDVPLVVPEVNGELLNTPSPLIANPNCVAAILTVALAPLRQLGRLRRVDVATYQSASGAGAKAMADLLAQTRDYLAGKEVIPRVLKHPYAFNLFSHDSDVEANDFNGEENKVMAETRKILDQEDLELSVTCVRVPVLRAHTEAVTVTFDCPVGADKARDALRNAPGITLVDDPDNNHFPMPNEATERDNVLIGRLRADLHDPHRLSFLVCGDQLLKGAALNAVQIAEALIGCASQRP
jgi:aspartate-semialdehyde dehydrogenase